MIKLLRAGMRRYIRSPLFILGLIASACSGLYCGLSLSGYTGHNFRTTDSIIPLFIIAVVTSLSIGREFSDGIFRNKIICGHTKGEIFLSEFILALVSSFAFAIIFLVGIYTLNIDAVNHLKPMFLLKILLGFIMLCMSFGSIFAFISCLISKKAISPIVCIIVLFMISIITFNMLIDLRQDEYIYDFSHTENTNIFSEDTAPDEFERQKQPNPFYVGGIQREIYKFIVDISPAGHLKEYVNMFNEQVGAKAELTKENIDSLNCNPLYSLCIIFVFCLIGYLLFRKKNFK